MVGERVPRGLSAGAEGVGVKPGERQPAEDDGGAKEGNGENVPAVGEPAGQTFAVGEELRGVAAQLAAVEREEATAEVGAAGGAAERISREPNFGRLADEIVVSYVQHGNAIASYADRAGRIGEVSAELVEGGHLDPQAEGSAGGDGDWRG